MEDCDKRTKDLANKSRFKRGGIEAQKQEIEAITRETKQHCDKVRQQLDFMQADVTEAESDFKKEPETNVKRMVHRVFTQRFHTMLRTMKSTQAEFKKELFSRTKVLIKTQD